MNNNTEKLIIVIADTINKVLTKAADNMGFALILFKFEDTDALVNYISNGERLTMIQALKDCIEHMEKTDSTKSAKLGDYFDEKGNTKKTQKA